MLENFKLENEIVFAFDAIMSGALSFEEFHIWIENVISSREDLPTYIFDIYDAKEFGDAGDFFHSATHIGSAGFNPVSSKESEVFWGIAALRGKNLKELEVPITEKTALKRMEQYPHVVHRFRELFPFVEF